jgi:hypothetical protein
MGSVVLIKIPPGIYYSAKVSAFPSEIHDSLRLRLYDLLRESDPIGFGVGGRGYREFLAQPFAWRDGLVSPNAPMSGAGVRSTEASAPLAG